MRFHKFTSPSHENNYLLMKPSNYFLCAMLLGDEQQTFVYNNICGKREGTFLGVLDIVHVSILYSLR